MSTMILAACIAVLLPAFASAQATMYVAYDGALVYSAADYLSDVVDTLHIADSVVVIERERRFARIQRNEGEGWVLLANISAKPPRRASTKAASASSGEPAISESPDSIARSRIPELRTTTDTLKSVSPNSRSDSRPSEDASAQCAGLTKTGKQCSRTSKDGSAYCWQHAK
ncbi:MAG: hypothetical protein H7X80_06250 [bacterium]|nr:hypothetical protein [Candidatus Kapabacteria bacterium]